MDYFTTKRAHGRPIHPGCEEAEAAACDFFVWRNNQWFSDPRVLELAAYPILRKFVRDCEEQLRNPEGAALLRVYAGHDISVLPVLHALVKPADRITLPWPLYASELQLDLYNTAAGPEVCIRFSQHDLFPMAIPYQEFLALIPK